MTFLYSVLSFIVVLGIIVLVHEFGHYIAARLTGVRVEVFSFGFGKRLFGKKIGETDFRFSLIPLGGYVKMAGEEEYDPKDLKPYEFQAKNRAQKIFILVMGAVMNVLLAFLIFTITFMTGVEVPSYKFEPPHIGYVEKGSPAEKAGIRKGDLILTVDGDPIANWEELEIAIGFNPDLEVPVEFQRDGKIIKKILDVKAISRYHVGHAGVHWDFKTEIDKVNQDSPAFKAGIKAGDLIMTINGEPVCYYEISAIIGKNAEKPIKLSMARGEEQFEKTIVPSKAYFLESRPLETIKEAGEELKKIEKLVPKLTFYVTQSEDKFKVRSDTMDTLPDPGLYGDRLIPGDRGLIGVEMRPHSPLVIIRYGFFIAMRESVAKMVGNIELVYKTIRKLIEGKLSTKSFSSVIDIAEISQKAAETGPTNFFLLIAFISLQLGLLNLLPIPALDGGHLLIYTIEAVVRKEFSQKVKNIIINIGFFLLISLMAFLLLNDIAKRLPNGWSSFLPF